MTVDMETPLTMELTLTMDEWADIGSMLMTISMDIEAEIRHVPDLEIKSRGTVMANRAANLAHTIKGKWHEAKEADGGS